MNLRWLGHIKRMDHNRLPRQLLCSRLKEGKHNQGRPGLGFKDTVKRNMKKLDMDRANWQKNARNRYGWICLIRPESTDCYDDDDKMSLSKASHTKEYQFCNQEL